MDLRPHGTEGGSHGTANCPHGVNFARTNRKMTARKDLLPHGKGIVPHRLILRLREANFAFIAPVKRASLSLKFQNHASRQFQLERFCAHRRGREGHLAQDGHRAGAIRLQGGAGRGRRAMPRNGARAPAQSGGPRHYDAEGPRHRGFETNPRRPGNAGHRRDHLHGQKF